MKQANYNGRLRAALAVLGVALTASHRLRGYPRMSPRFARLNTGLRTAATPPGCPARSASKWVADCVPCEPIRALLCEQLGCRLRALRCRFEHCSASKWVADCLPCDAASSTALRAIGVADCVPCDAASSARSASNWGCRLRALQCSFSLAADENQRGELAMPICPVGLCGVALPFHDVKVRFKFRGY